MKPNVFSKVAILGLGLIGGSVGLDIKKQKLASKVVGYNRSGKGRRLALKKKACDEVFASPEAAVEDADLVILATPVQTISHLARAIAPRLKPGAIITDVGSTKEHVVKKLKRLLPSTVFYVGGHPIAGNERSGMEAAVNGLFNSRWWILTPHRGGKRYRIASRCLEGWIKKFGARTAMMSPQDHDRVLAMISHLPHLVAYAMVDTAAAWRGGKAIRYSAGGFRDFTRIAASSAQMWAEICMDNRGPILRMLKKYEKHLGQIQKLIAAGHGKKLERLFNSVGRVRRRL